VTVSLAAFQRGALHSASTVLQTLEGSGTAFVQGVGTCGSSGGRPRPSRTCRLGCGGLSVVDKSVERVFSSIAPGVGAQDSLFRSEGAGMRGPVRELALGGGGVATSVPQILATGPAWHRPVGAVREAFRIATRRGRRLQSPALDQGWQSAAARVAPVAFADPGRHPLTLVDQLPGMAGYSGTSSSVCSWCHGCRL